jgi:hypothetical protein
VDGSGFTIGAVELPGVAAVAVVGTMALLKPVVTNDVGAKLLGPAGRRLVVLTNVFGTPPPRVGTVLTVVDGTSVRTVVPVNVLNVVPTGVISGVLNPENGKTLKVLPPVIRSGACAPDVGNGLKLVPPDEIDGVFAPDKGNGLNVLPPVVKSGALAPEVGNGLKTPVFVRLNGADAPDVGNTLKVPPLVRIGVVPLVVSAPAVIGTAQAVEADNARASATKTTA